MRAQTYVLDAYVFDTLMADLVGHDHQPSAFLVYLALVASAGDGRCALSYSALADRTGLSKRGVQNAVKTLCKRSLIEITRRGPTETPHYRPLAPWRRDSG